MSRYYSFNDFMSDVIKKADEISRQKNNVGLEELFHVSLLTLTSTQSLISYGWAIFIAVATLFLLGPIAFIAALASFLLTPIGLIVATVLGVAAYKTIKAMYRDRDLPLAVKSVGEEYKPRWEAADGNSSLIDQLLKDAVISLYEKAHDVAMISFARGILYDCIHIPY